MSVATSVKIETRWHDENTLQCLHDGRVVAETFWNGGEWVFFVMRQTGATFEVDPSRGQVWISPDPEREQRFRDEAVQIRLDAEDSAARVVQLAELEGRRKMYRDDEDVRDLVRIRSKLLARMVVRGHSFRQEET